MRFIDSRFDRRRYPMKYLQIRFSRVCKKKLCKSVEYKPRYKSFRISQAVVQYERNSRIYSRYKSMSECNEVVFMYAYSWLARVFILKWMIYFFDEIFVYVDQWTVIYYVCTFVRDRSRLYYFCLLLFHLCIVSPLALCFTYTVFLFSTHLFSLFSNINLVFSSFVIILFIDTLWLMGWYFKKD